MLDEFTNGSRTGFFYMSGWVEKSIPPPPRQNFLYV